MDRRRKKQSSFHKSSRPDPKQDWSYPVRLNKYIAKCGSWSRRAAADLVKDGQVELNGVKVLEPFVLVEETDVVKVEGKQVKPEARLYYILLNKPKNTITTTQDDKDRKTVMDLIDVNPAYRLFPVGRLDRNTVGLLLITNDGKLAEKLTHPSNKVTKKYKVSIDKPLSDRDFSLIKNGLTLEDGPAPVDELLFQKTHNRKKLEISIHMGRNRIVRRIFEHLGYTVTYLERFYMAGLTTEGVLIGRYRYLREREIIMLKHFV